METLRAKSGVGAMPRVPPAQEAEASVQGCRDELDNRWGKETVKTCKNYPARNNPSSQRQAEELCEFEASLIYRASSRTAKPRLHREILS